MPKFSIDIKASIFKRIENEFKNLPREVDKKTADAVGRAPIKEMKDQISKGISPIREGPKRFPAYKNPKKYPGKRKGKRPVNLKLTGDFLRSLSFKALQGGKGYITRIFFDDSDGLSDLKEQGHREGASVV